jgi:hypothetical protein
MEQTKERLASLECEILIDQLSNPQYSVSGLDKTLLNCVVMDYCLVFPDGLIRILKDIKEWQSQLPPNRIEQFLEPGSRRFESGFTGILRDCGALMMSSLLCQGSSKIGVYGLADPQTFFDRVREHFKDPEELIRYEQISETSKGLSITK